MVFEALTTKMAGRVAFGEKVRLYFSKEKRKNHGSCYRRKKIDKSALPWFCVRVARARARGREREVCTIIEKRAEGEKEREI